MTPTIVFPNPETADQVQAQLAAGITAIQAARDAASQDVAVAEGLRTTAANLKTQAETQRTQVLAFTPNATYSQAQLAAVRDAVGQVLARQALILEALAGLFAHRGAVDQNAVRTDDALLWLARLAAGVLEDTPTTPND